MQSRMRPSLAAVGGWKLPGGGRTRHDSDRRARATAIASAAALAALLALIGPLAGRADASSISLVSGITPASYSIEGGATGTAVNKCTNGGWAAPLSGGSWIGVSNDCTVGDAASNKTTDYDVTFTLPAGFTAPVLNVQEAADNFGRIFVNGHEVESATATYNAFTTTTTTPGEAFVFAAGTNTIDFQVQDTGGPNGVDFAGTVSFTSANLSLTKTAAPVSPPGCSPAQGTQPCVLHGQEVTYTLTESNAGPDTATAPTITDTLPAGQTFVSSDDASCTASGTPVVVSCPTADLPNGSSETIHIVASTAGIPAPLSAPLAQTDTATVSSATGDPNPANNTATATITVVPAADLSLTKTSAPNPVIAGQQLTYTLTASNAGPDTAVNTVITDPLPAGETLETEGVVEVVRNTIGGSINISGNDAAVPTPGAGEATCTSSTSGGVTTVSCPVGNIPAGGSATVTILAVPNGTAATTLVNTATVSSATADPNPANNTASTTTTVSSACTTTTTGQTNGAIIVPAGEFLCLTNAKVGGAVIVDPGGAVTVTNSTTAAIDASSPVFVTVCGSTLVNGSIDVNNASGLVRIGDAPFACAPNRISGSVTLTDNHGGDGGPAIVGNTVVGSIDCRADNPVATDDGQTNQAGGAKLGECTGASF
jgi:uncharacterized repeat protein (TIGR01451 family)